MLRKVNRIVSLALAFVLLASVLIPALTGRTQALRYDGSAGYESGKFYKALTEVSLTGDPRVDIVNVAKSQVGYQEGGSNNQLSGEVYGGLNFTEYGRWYGAQDMWCAMFASWCAHVAGISTNVIPSHAYTPNGLQWFKDRGLAHSQEDIEAGKYTPRAGDLIYFRSSRNTNRTNHVGIVTGCSDGTIYTVEGNTSTAGISTNGGTVGAKSYPITNTYIVAVCSPKYTVGSTSVENEPVEVPVQKEEPTVEKKPEKPVEDKKPVQAEKPVIKVETNAAGATSSQMAVLRKAICSVETGGDGGYDRITESYLGGISGHAITIGSGQWYGMEARELLMQIRSADEKRFAKLDTAGIGLDLDEQDWNSYRICPDSDKAECIRAILSSNAGIRVQDEMIDRRMLSYMQEAEKLGVTKLEAKMLCAGLRHLGGANAVERVLGQVEGKYTLENIYEALSGEEFGYLRASGTMLYNAIISE